MPFLASISSIERTYAAYKKLASFYVVYIREAHVLEPAEESAKDDALSANELKAKAFAERRVQANSLAENSGPR